ncbi:MAG TPA: PmoA family protein [Actinospica sp.]|nr:PmoA family protein [Actinospica sp.]
MTPQLRLAGRAVADYVLEPEVDPTNVPRPYLHPVRTLAGTVVTDALPADHEWHLGAGLAIADVAGTNLWGGRSYVHGKGYVRLPDHGRIEHASWHQYTDSVLDHDLVWRDHDGAGLLAERRRITAEPGPTAESWTLTFATTLTNLRSDPIEIRSPATNGRGDGAGYGGFFWRLPAVERMRVEARDPRTADRARGEGFVNGSALPELDVRGEIGGRRVALTFAGPQYADRWFVRVAEYPAVGVSFAHRHPLPLAPGAELARTFTVTVADD